MISTNTSSYHQQFVWEFILNKLDNNIPVILMYVLESHGSSPGRQGFKMAVAADNEFIGTIGGGIMEHKFVEMAKSHFISDSVKERVFRQVHDKSSDRQSGMICSGEQTIFLYPVKLSDRNHIKSTAEYLSQNKNASLILNPEGIFFSTTIPKQNFLFDNSNEDFVLTEKIGFKNIIHIIGGGHCSLALCRILNDLDFYINLYDNRRDLVTMKQNIYAHNIMLLEDYTDLKDIVLGGANEYVVLMTFGYRTDDAAFRALWGKSFKYIVMLGSQKKIEKLKKDYLSENMDEKYLNNLFAPVGMPINSETAAEIAVSIAAQIIAVKNAR